MVKILGFILILFGLWVTLFNHGFGTMINPAVSDREWWNQYLRATWQGDIFSLATMFVGGLLLFSGWKRRTTIEEPKHFLYIGREKSKNPPGHDLE